MTQPTLYRGKPRCASLTVVLLSPSSETNG